MSVDTSDPPARAVDAYSPNQSEIPALFDAVREGLGTSEMSLKEMVWEMRQIRESSDYEAKA